MEKNVTFTVFIPCYGECLHLKETLDSLYDQDYEVEIVVCAQGDTRVENVLRDYPNVKLLHLERPSSYKTRIFLFNQSKSDYIYYVDDDDVLPKNLFKYINKLINQTGFLDLYRIPLKEFKDEEWTDNLREQKTGNSFVIERKEDFLKKCLNGKYHNGIVHLFIKNGLTPNWFDVDVFQTEDRLLTFSIVESIKTDVCVIDDIFYLYRKYPLSHSRTRDFLKGKDDFITVNNCLMKYMTIEDLIFNSNAILLRVISYLKYLSCEKQFKRANFNKIFENSQLFDYLKIFLKNKKILKKNVGIFATIMCKLIYKKRFITSKLFVAYKCKQELRKYKQVQF